LQQQDTRFTAGKIVHRPAVVLGLCRWMNVAVRVASLVLSIDPVTIRAAGVSE
jgi:hypothetical protein